MSATAERAPTREDFAAMLEESFGQNEAFEGTVVKGRITAIEKDLALIDVGLKMEGRVPLKEFGIGSIVLENPYYGSRRPKDQDRSYLRSVSDLWAMGLAVVSETRALLEWLKEQGFRNLGVCGVSMGGAMVSQAAALTPYPLAVCACIAPHCATPVFLEGVLSKYVDWEALGEGGRERLGKQLDGSDLRLFPQPPRPDCAIWLGAKNDAYVDPTSSMLTAEAWPGSKMKWLKAGHVSTTIFHRNQYIRGIQDGFRRLTGPAQEVGVWLP